MTPKQKFIAALERKPITGRVPHFELVFFLTMEVLGKMHPEHRSYHQWNQMSEKEKQAHYIDIADLYIAIAEKYEHSAIFVHGAPGGTLENVKALLRVIRERGGDKYFLMMHGDPTYSMPNGDNMVAFTESMYESPDTVKANAQACANHFIAYAEDLAKDRLLDGFAMCADYCLNANPFFTPDMFSEFIAPYLFKSIAAYREMGYYVIKHTDGNIMPIIDQMVQCNPHALHSLDPQGGVDLKRVKKQYGDRICLVGNVNCGLLQTGTDQEAAADVRRSLRDGMPGYGYIFSTSNCVYTGLPLERYEMMVDIWRKEGNY